MDSWFLKKTEDKEETLSKEETPSKEEETMVEFEEASSSSEKTPSSKKSGGFGLFKPKPKTDEDSGPRFSMFGRKKEESPEKEEKEASEEDESKSEKNSGFGLFKSKPKTEENSGPRFSMFARNKEESPENEEEPAERSSEAEEERKPLKSSGFGLFKPKPKADSEESASAPRFSMFARKVSSPEASASPAPASEKTEQEIAEEMADAEVQEIEEEEIEDEVTWEDRMRNILRSVGVDTIEDDDDWKQMVIKTRLMLKDIKDMYLNNKGTKEERTKKFIIVINDDNVLEIQFRLDFIHRTPQNEEPPSDEDEHEIPADLTGLETPVMGERPSAKKKRLKRIIKAITRAQKLNKKRLKRLEEKRRIRAEEERIRREIEHAERERKRLALRREKATERGVRTLSVSSCSTPYEPSESEPEEVEIGEVPTAEIPEEELTPEQKQEREEKEAARAEKKAAWMTEHKLRKKGRVLARGEEWVSSDEEAEEEEEDDDRSILGKIEDETGVRIIFKTDKLEARLQEYKEIFFGPDLTEEEIAELEKIAADDKTFYVHLKFIVRKKTWEELEEERRLKEEEEARKRAEEEAAAKGEGGEEGEEGELDEAEERKREKRKELARKAGDDSDEETGEIEYDQVPI